MCSQTAANQRTVVEIELLAIVGWKWGCQPFSCRCSQNMTHCRKEICSTCLYKCYMSIRSPCLLWNQSLHSLLYQKLEVPKSGSTLPSLQLQKNTCLMQRSKGFGHAVVVTKICYNGVFVLSVVVWDCCKPTNTCRDWAFSNSGLEVGLPAFQLPMFAKCDALPKGDLLDMFV